MAGWLVWAGGKDIGFDYCYCYCYCYCYIYYYYYYYYYYYDGNRDRALGTTYL